MSIINSVANVKKPFCEAGSCRKVFYSKKYDAIIKVPLYTKEKNAFQFNQYHTQTNNESFIWNEILTEQQKQFFPVIDYVYSEKYQGLVTIMNKVDFILGDRYALNNCLEEMSEDVLRNVLVKIANKYGLTFDMELFINTIWEVGISDLHEYNLGVYKNRLVIIDFGWSE